MKRREFLGWSIAGAVATVSSPRVRAAAAAADDRNELARGNMEIDTAPQWSERASGVRLLAGALAAIECESEDIIERHSHAIVIGCVLHVEISSHDTALAYWHGDYVAIDRDEDMARLADVSLPAGHHREIPTVSRFTRWKADGIRDGNHGSSRRPVAC